MVRRTGFCGKVLTAFMPNKAWAWYAKRYIRRCSPQVVSDWLLGKESAAYHLWSIGIVAGSSPFELRHEGPVSNPVLTRQDVSDVRALFVADPFMIRVRHVWHMFFEVYNYDADRGEIGWATSPDGFAWTYKQIVLREPFHLSYPYVFEWQNSYYMVPESHQVKQVRLYEATRFPTDWVCTDVLLAGLSYNDSSPFHHGGYWWLFSETNPALTHDTLRLYYATDLRRGWQEHPCSPVVQGNPHVARPAGRVVVLADRVIRFAQDCSPTYGISVRAFEITELTPSTYREQPLSQEAVIGPTWRLWTQGGMHHVDPHRLDANRWIASADGWRPVGWLVPDEWQRA
jgi:hypothetical protein